MGVGNLTTPKRFMLGNSDYPGFAALGNQDYPATVQSGELKLPWRTRKWGISLTRDMICALQRGTSMRMIMGISYP